MKTTRQWFAATFFLGPALVLRGLTYQSAVAACDIGYLGYKHVLFYLEL